MKITGRTMPSYLLFVLSFCSLTACGTYSHGPAKVDDPDTIEPLIESIPDGEAIAWFHPAWLYAGKNLFQTWGLKGSGAAGMLVLTETNVYFQIWHIDDTYRTYSVTPICDIVELISQEDGLRSFTVTLVSDRPNGYNITTPFGWAAHEEAKKFRQLLRSRMENCTEGSVTGGNNLTHQSILVRIWPKTDALFERQVPRFKDTDQPLTGAARPFDDLHDHSTA